MTNHKDIILSASLIAADFMHLADELEATAAAGIDRIHFDVMDHHYVPNLSIGPMVCRSLKEHGAKLPVGVHLMVTDPDQYIEPFAQAGAALITFHPETSANVDATLQKIRSHNVATGLAFNPNQPVEIENSWLEQLDQILIMSVYPGFAGQKFIPEVLDKVRDTRTKIDSWKKPIHLAMDGGIGPDTIGECIAAGADYFVVGSAFYHAPDYAERVQQLRSKNN